MLSWPSVRLGPGVLASLLLGCSSHHASTASMSSPPTDPPAPWHFLFDGRSLDAWRGFRGETVPAGWRIVEGAITRVGPGGDLITREQFDDFELVLDWKVAEGGNSGILYRVTEDAEATYQTGPEMQVLDDARHEDGRSPLTSAGAVYGVYPAAAGAVRPGGEWNAARIVARGGHVEHWLNGIKVVDYELWSPDWELRVRASKFSRWPGYGRARSGHIALQDHGDRVAYRVIRIRSLGPGRRGPGA